MSGNFIVNTPKYQMHALAYQGIMVVDCYAQIRDLLRSRLGDDYVLLFAEPVSNAADNSVDWYTPVQGTPRPLTDLPPDEQNVLREKLARMAGDIRTVADELKKSPENSRVGRGHVLDAALRYPNERCLYVVGGQPVFTCWGFGPGTPGAEPQDLSRLARLVPAAAATAVASTAPEPEKPTVAPMPPPPDAPAAGESRTFGWGWLWWLLPLLLLLLLLWVAMTSFGTWPSLSGTTWFHAPALPFSDRAASGLSDELAALQEKSAVTTQDLENLRGRLLEHGKQCTPSNAPAEPKKGEELVIPEKPQDIAFLNGHWRCDTGLINSRTNEPVVVEFTFDADGKGQSVVYEKNDVCTGAVQASLLSDGLRVDVDEQQCRNDRSYNKMRIECQNKNGAAQCSGVHSSGKSWTAKFYRIQ